MHRFTVISPDDRIAPAEFRARDASPLLGFLHRLGWRTADVERDGLYLCSIHADENEVWSVSQRDQCQRYSEAPPPYYNL